MRWKFLELQQICVETVQKGVSQERVWHFTRWFFCSILFEYTIWSQPLLGETRIPIPQLHHIVRAPLRCETTGAWHCYDELLVEYVRREKCLCSCKGPSTMLYRGMVQSLTSSWWASHEYPLTDCVRQEERTSWGAWIDKVFLTEREVFMPLANLSWDCKSLGGCVNSMVDWGRAHVWSVERPPLVPKGEKKLEARLRCGDYRFRKAGSEPGPRALPNW